MHTIVSFPNKICQSISKFLKTFYLLQVTYFFTFIAGARAGAGAAKINKSGAGAAKTGGSDNTAERLYDAPSLKKSACAAVRGIH